MYTFPNFYAQWRIIHPKRKRERRRPIQGSVVPFAGREKKERCITQHSSFWIAVGLSFMVAVYPANLKEL